MFKLNAGVITLGAAVLLSTVAVAWADEDNDLIGKDAVSGFTGTVAFTNEYRFRGISQTTNGVPAVQGSLEYDHDSGIYVGLWGSNVKFTDASIEMDWYGGWKGSIGDIADVGLGAIYYYYPGSAGSLNYDYWEITPSVSHDFGPFSASVALYYSPDYFASSGDGVYISPGISVPIWKSLALNLHYGHQWIQNNAAFGTPDYSDYSVGFSATVLGFDTSLSWTDTDMSKMDCFGGTSFCNSAAIFSVGRSF